MEDNSSMVNIGLDHEGKALLKSLIGKELIQYRHDPLDKFGGVKVYGRIEMFFDDSIILIEYDYAPYPLFGSTDDEHPVFSIKKISEEEAVSALEDVSQINIRFEKVISGVSLIEDTIDIEWDGKKDSTRLLKAIILKFGKEEIAIQGDYMMPLLDIIKGTNVTSKLLEPGEEYKEDSEIKYIAKRFIVDL
jgi:hypothetical protein